MHNAAKSIEQRIEDLGEIEAPENISTIRFRQSKALELHNPYPIIGEEVNKNFGDNVLFKKASFQIPLGANVALVGDNGSGKTTVLDAVTSVLSSYSSYDIERISIALSKYVRNFKIEMGLK